MNKSEKKSRDVIGLVYDKDTDQFEIDIHSNQQDGIPYRDLKQHWKPGPEIFNQFEEDYLINELLKALKKGVSCIQLEDHLIFLGEIHNYLLIYSKKYKEKCWPEYLLEKV